MRRLGADCSVVVMKRVMPVERREQVIAVSSGQPDHTGRSPNVQRKAAALMRWHEPDDARVSRPDL